MPFGKAILWDMDGVLADTIQLHFDVWEQTLTGLGIAYSRQKFQGIFGLKDREFLPVLIDQPLDSGRLDAITHQKQQAFTQAVYGNVQPLPGVLDWLTQFQSWGFKQAVASSAPLHNVEAIIEALNIRQFFEALVTPGDKPGKPDPAVFVDASIQLKTHPRDCIVIEDSIPGIIAAHSAKMRCIAVATTKPAKDLQQADLVVTNLSELSVEQFETLL